ncbi:MAG: M50 family metallopeptidase [Elusimicrobia bacterium]|nr:M50 family metallopeptidase [Elusimicrobiota bacterium]
MIDRSPVSWGRAALLAALFVLAFLYWDKALFHPLRILVTLFHELGHGLAGVLTGGRIEVITVDSMGGGLCYVSGGWRWVVLPAGYIGSMGAGCAILILACRTRWDRFVAMALGGALVLACVVFVRSWTGFLYGTASGLALIASGRWLNEEFNDLLLCFIGSTSCLYAVLDVRHLMRLGRGYNDAAMFSQEILPLPPVVWAFLWGALSVIVLAATLVIALRRLPPASVPGSGLKLRGW